MSSRKKVNSVHLDKVPKDDIMKDAITCCQEVNVEFFSIIVYASPRSLSTKDGPSPSLKFLLANDHLLSMIVRDGIHLINLFWKIILEQISDVEGWFISESETEHDHAIPDCNLYIFHFNIVRKIDRCEL